jgi:hypothetical protein
MGVYGSQLDAFPELMEQYEVFSMSPLAEGGWSPRKKEAVIRAYISMTRPSRMGFEDGNAETNHAGTMWVDHEDGSRHIRQGLYVEYEGEAYKIIDDNPYIKEGGFCEYRLQVVKGTDGTQVPVPSVERRIVDDY